MLSENIKNLRKQKGYTQETLAQSLNIVRQTVSKWEKGYSVPDADMLEKLAEVLEVPVINLLGNETDIEQKSELERISSQLAILNEQMARELARRKRNRKIKIIAGSVLGLLLVTGLIWIFISKPLDQSIPKGDISHAEVDIGNSELFTPSQIKYASEAVKEEFAGNWDGCELLQICYAGDNESRYESENRGYEVIVLVSDFETHRLPGNSSLASDSTYREWKWILMSSGAGWQVVDYGY